MDTSSMTVRKYDKAGRVAMIEIRKSGRQQAPRLVQRERGEAGQGQTAAAKDEKK